MKRIVLLGLGLSLFVPVAASARNARLNQKELSLSVVNHSNFRARWIYQVDSLMKGTRHVQVPKKHGFRGATFFPPVTDYEVYSWEVDVFPTAKQTPMIPCSISAAALPAIQPYEHPWQSVLISIDGDTPQTVRCTVDENI